MSFECRHTGKCLVSMVYVLAFLLAFPPSVLAQLTVLDYGLCRVEGESRQAKVGDSPDGVRTSKEISIVEKTNMISATKGTCFGVLFTAPQSDTENVGLEARIYHPPIALTDGSVKESTELPLFIFTDKPSFVGWQFNSDNELVSGDWVIEFTNDYKVLGRQRFMVQATPVAENAIGEPVSGVAQGYDDAVASQPAESVVVPEPIEEPEPFVPEPVIEPEPASEVVSAPAPALDKPDHPVEKEVSRPATDHVFTGEWETVTRYLVQVAAHSKQSNMVAYEQKLKGMGLSPFSFVGPCNCPYKDLYLTFVFIGNSREAAADYSRRVTEEFGIDSFVKPIRAVVPAGWQLD